MPLLKVKNLLTKESLIVVERNCNSDKSFVKICEWMPNWNITDKMDTGMYGWTTGKHVEIKFPMPVAPPVVGGGGMKHCISSSLYHQDWTQRTAHSSRGATTFWMIGGTSYDPFQSLFPPPIFSVSPFLFPSFHPFLPLPTAAKWRVCRLPQQVQIDKNALQYALWCKHF